VVLFPARQHQIPTEPIRIGDALISSSSIVRDLGVYIDANITMKTHVTFLVRSCFASLRQLCSIRRSIPPHALQTLIHALVISRIDYCSSVLAGMPGTQLRRLQSVLNAAARLIFSARRHDHITPLLRELHWLRCRRESSFGCVSWRISAFTVQHHLTSLSRFTWSPTPTAASVSAQRLK
jgi:hypothetical protein